MSVKGFNTTDGVVKYDYNSLDNLPVDTGWVDCTLSSNAVNYQNDAANKPQVRRVGSQVYLRGIISPKTGGVTEINPAFSIPEGFRPAKNMNVVQQGSVSNRFLLTISANGNVTIGRYTNTTATSMEIASSAWLNCYASWLVG